MATKPKLRPQNRKRQYTEADISQDDLPPLPSKRLKSSRERCSASRFPPPSFWDNLSKVWLTPRALKELDRRNQLDYPAPARASLPIPKPARQNSDRRDLQRFARHGGPELRDLRGYPEPRTTSLELKMSSSRSSRSSRSYGSKKSKSTNLSSNSSKTSNTEGSRRRSSAYDADFEQHLIDNGININSRKSKQNNLKEIREILAQPRPSLSPSRFGDEEFEDYQQKNEDVIDEGEVMRNVLPILYGDSDIPSKQNLLFTRLESITNNSTVDPQPDFYDGARLEDIDERVRDDLGPYIIPTKHRTAPVAPNFFIEAKAPKGGADVAKRQACHDGAIGARAMHKLQSYGEEEPVFDNNAYSFASTYHAGTGTLQMYATHVTSSGSGGSLEYHMSQTGAFALNGCRDQFVQGATHLRNQRDHAKKKRDQFISAANERARSMYAGSSNLDSSGYHDASNTTDEHPTESQSSIDDFATSFAYPTKKPSYDSLSDIVEEHYEEDELSGDELPTSSFSYRVQESDSADELALDMPRKSTSSKRRSSRGLEKTGSKAPRRTSTSYGKRRSDRN